MSLHEPPEVHFERTLVRPTVVLGACAVITVGTAVWIVFAVTEPVARACALAAVAVATLGSLVAGNTFRLRDLRQRRAYQLRVLAKGDPTRTEAWSRLVPPATIRWRLALGLSGAGLGLATYVGNLVLADGIGLGLRLTACLVGLVTALVALFAGSVVSPLD